MSGFSDAYNQATANQFGGSSPAQSAQLAQAQANIKAFINAAGALQAQQAGSYAQIGRVLVSEVGEASVDIGFYNIFTSQPIFTFGSELDANQAVVAGSFPTLSASVLRWQATTNPAKQSLYTGATVVLKVGGVAGQKLWFHFCFQGTALTFPAGAQPSNTTGNA